MSTEETTNHSGWSEETSRVFIDYGRYFVPERDHQLQIIVTLLSHLSGPATVLELCCGEGLLAERLLVALPTVTVYGLDGSAEMLQRAGERLARFGNRFRCSAFDLAAGAWRTPGVAVEAVVSSMAIHHLTGPQKQQLFCDLHQMLADNGVLVIADIVEHVHPQGTRLAAETW
ncbi:MAG: class I SAM-dependent methyltransferase, partial [Anaerolineae bacterium]